VAWHGAPLGQLSHNGFEWRWKPQKGRGRVLERETIPDKLPAFIESLLPEGWLAQVLHDRDERETLRRGRRYMSDISLVESRAELADLPADILMTPLASFADADTLPGTMRALRGQTSRKSSSRSRRGSSRSRRRRACLVSRSRCR
jgi:serine/threonine-protein kinase HipA